MRYERPKMSLILLEEVDVIRTSSLGDGGTGTDKSEPEIPWPGIGANSTNPNFK